MAAIKRNIFDYGENYGEKIKNIGVFKSDSETF